MNYSYDDVILLYKINNNKVMLKSIFTRSNKLVQTFFIKSNICKYHTHSLTGGQVIYKKLIEHNRNNLKI